MFINDYMKVIPGLFVGKFCITFSRYFNFGGSTLPGKLASCISPHLLSILASQLKEGSILITGTNGKTTTAYLLAGILSRAGKKVIHNRTGANLIFGVTTPFIAESTYVGKIKADVGVLEVDEASMPAVASQLPVKGVIVTNLFPDQLDRFGELQYTLDLIARGIDSLDKNSFILLNADDPLVSSLKKDVRTIYYGIDDVKGASGLNGHASDIKMCYRCGNKYEYIHTHFAHLGIYKCPGCGLSRPRPQYSIISRFNKPNNNTEVAIKIPGSLFRIPVKIPGFYNLYNVLAAVSCALELGVKKNVIKSSLQDFTAAFGRMELLDIGGKKIYLILIKNPTGANEVLRTLMEEDIETSLIFAINDRYADGTDVSWLWDADFELLADPHNKIRFIFCSGTRGEDMAVRLKYAGIDTKLIKYEKDMRKAFIEGLNQTPKGGVLQLMLTYTALLELRKIINEMGYGSKFWEC